MRMVVRNKKKLRLLAAMAASSMGISAAVIAADTVPPEIPKCDKKIGTLAVKEPESTWWVDLQLESPEALIKVFVNESKCFTLVDRGKGLAAAQAERALAGGGEMRGGSNVGKGQMKAADYVLVPDIVNKNAKSGGTNIGGMLGGMLGGTAGAVLGGISLKSKTADVVLTLTDVRSTEQVSLQQGHAKKTDLGWGAGGGAFFGGFAAGGASSYANTEIGQVVDGGLPRRLRQAGHRRQADPAGCQGQQRHAVGDHGQARQDVRDAERQGQGRARPGSGHDAVPDRREGGHLVEGHGRAGQRGLGADRRCSGWPSKL